MPILRETIKCSKCGCLALPDAIRCPKCGSQYERERPTKPLIDPLKCYESPAIESTNMKVIRAYYQLSCVRHGIVQVRASVIGTPLKCPFCE